MNPTPEKKACNPYLLNYVCDVIANIRSIATAFTMHKNNITLLILSSVFISPSVAQPILSDDTLSIFEVDARIRNGNRAFESALYTPGTPPPGDPGGEQWQMNPTGSPIWNSYGNSYGDVHSFQLTYTMETGTTVWKIDFNRDGDYADPSESVLSEAPALAGKGFQYVNIWGQGNVLGRTASVTDCTINGVNVGSFSSSSDTPFSMLYEDETGMFTDLLVTGQFSFSGDGGKERPRVWIRLGTPNTPPTCTVTNPIQGTIFTLGEPILLSASASDPDGSIDLVEFYIDNVKIGEDHISPYQLTWIGTPSGSHTVKAKAIDIPGAMTFSDPITFAVETNEPPTCSIILPMPGFVFLFPDSIVIEAEATDPDDGIVAVEFYLDSILLGVDSVYPYQMTWLAPTPGLYALTARSVDASDAFALSAAVNGIINAPPTCAIINPTNGFIFYDPDIIVIDVEATDDTDAIANVEFYIDSASLGLDLEMPYWNNTLVNTPIGSYTLYAKATDIYDVFTFASPIEITVRCIREDLDLNGTVNTNDYLLLLSSFGISCASCNEDFNEDGGVNTIDFLRLLTKIGYTCN